MNEPKAKPEQHPAAGGSYTRNPDGSLTKRPPAPSNPRLKRKPVGTAPPAAPSAEPAAEPEGAQRRGGGARHAD